MLVKGNKSQYKRLLFQGVFCLIGVFLFAYLIPIAYLKEVLAVYFFVLVALFIEQRFQSKFTNKLIYKDDLTEAYNFRGLIQKFNDFEYLRRQNNQPYSIVLFDIDNFKQINTESGYSKGDELLKLVCEAVVSKLRNDDVLFRYKKGDEFLYYLKNSDNTGALIVAERIRETIANRFKEFNITISSGIVTINRDFKMEDALKLLEEKLQEAKKNKNACIQ